MTDYSTSTNMDVLIDIAMSEEETVDVFQTSGCDLEFRPLYQCSHIYSTLDKLDEFKVLYEDKRQVLFRTKTHHPVPDTSRRHV